MNAIGYFEIQSNNPEKAAEFYANVFGWKFIEETDLPVKYWRIETEGMNGGLLERPATMPPPECGTNAFTCSIEIADFEATTRLILANGGQIALPKFEIPGRCWQGYFIDSDNNVFGIFQTIK